jgi:hypothetical protein
MEVSKPEKNNRRKENGSTFFTTYFFDVKFNISP